MYRIKRNHEAPKIRATRVMTAIGLPLAASPILIAPESHRNGRYAPVVKFRGRKY